MNIIKSYSYKDISIICSNLSTLYGSGIEIVKSMELIMDFPIKKEYKESIKEIKREIEDGNSIGEGFSRFPNLYPPFLIGMISIGEKTGKLKEVLDEMSLYFTRKYNLRKEIVNGMTYPIILLCTMIFSTVFFLLFIIPQLEGMYTAIEGNLSTLGRGIIFLSKNLRENPYTALVFISIWIIILIFLIRYYKENYSKNIFSKLKIISDLKEYEIILLIKVIVSSGINISIALTYCEEESKNNLIYKRLNEEILSGNSISDSILKVINPSSYTLAMIKLGEESGELDEILKRLTDGLNKKCNERFKKLAAIMQPSMIILIAFIVLIFIGTFIIPMFEGMYGGIN